VVKCRPPKNRAPQPEEVEACIGFLHKQIEIISPEVIVCLGAVAAQNLLRTSTGITKLRGEFQEFHGIPVMATYHPAYLLRSPNKKRDVWRDMKTVMARLGL
jgi:DNA polymerase